MSDVVVLSDADEIPDAERLNAVLACPLFNGRKDLAGGVAHGLAPV